MEEKEEKPPSVKPHLWQKFQELQARKKKLTNVTTEQQDQSKSTGSQQENSTKQDVHEPKAGSSKTELDNLNKYIGQMDHLKGINQGRYALKTGLDDKIDVAIASGDIDLAEKLSDQIANRKFGERVAGAFDAKRLAEKRKLEQTKKTAKKKKLAWGFEAKERWETKGNM